MTSTFSEEFLDEALDRIIKREFPNGFDCVNDINGSGENFGKGLYFLYENTIQKNSNYIGINLTNFFFLSLILYISNTNQTFRSFFFFAMAMSFLVSFNHFNFFLLFVYGCKNRENFNILLCQSNRFNIYR